MSVKSHTSSESSRSPASGTAGGAPKGYRIIRRGAVAASPASTTPAVVPPMPVSDSARPKPEALSGLGESRDPERSAATVAAPKSVSPPGPEEGKADEPKLDYRRGLPIADDADPQKAVSVMVSMAEGKIGSVYYPDGSRIRTVHPSGPSSEAEDGVDGQYNVDWSQVPRSLGVKKEDGTDQLDASKTRRKVAAELRSKPGESDPKETPSWATPVGYSAEGKPLAPRAGDQKKQPQLLEVFKNGLHPSRGAAVAMDLKVEELKVLQEAWDHISDGVLSEEEQQGKSKEEIRKLKEERAPALNQRFYQYIQERLPESELLKRIRGPEEDESKREGLFPAAPSSGAAVDDDV